MLQAWSLPCGQVAFVDYDTIPLRPFDHVFTLCGALDQVTPKKKGIRLINAGLLVIRTNATLHRELVHQAERDKLTSVPRLYAEQEFLIHAFPNWKELPQDYNIPQYVARRATSSAVQRSDADDVVKRGYLLHE